MDDNKYWFSLWTVIISAFTVLMAVCAGCEMYCTKQYTEHGYVRVQKQGTTESLWTLPAEATREDAHE